MLQSTIMSFPNRGPWGDRKWRGNCSGHVIKELLEYFKPQKFIEIFAGSGTGYDVAKELGVNSIHLDLNPTFGGFNVLTDDLPAGADFIFSHPPYHSMIPYSGKGGMWGQHQPPHPDDLSRCATYEEFVHKMNIANARIYNALLNGGRHAMLIGDMRKNGQYYSMIKDLAWYGDLEVHIIKTQHNTVSDNREYATPIIKIAHEHLLVFKKNQVWLINIKQTKTETRTLKESTLITWRDLVQAALESLGGASDLTGLYAELADTKKAKGNSNWQAKIRQTLQLHDEFQSEQRGYWRLGVSSLRTAV